MYEAGKERYDSMSYPRCGSSGLRLPAVSLGLWHNFGDHSDYATSRKMALRAFDLGITHFDLANNYGPAPGAAEKTFGRILKEDLASYRDELVISTKAGYTMWPGPYGDFGSRKYLISSLDRSLERMGIEYVDIFYHHRPDPDTPLEETMGALDQIVRSGKALYIGLSNYYDASVAARAFKILKDLGTPCLIHQVKYNMFDRRIEHEVLNASGQQGVGTITFSPLAQGLLTSRYLKGIPEDSRMASDSVFLSSDILDVNLVKRLKALAGIAEDRGQSLAQLALAWNLRQEEVTSVLIGASRVSQIEECVGALRELKFTQEELDLIDRILAE